MRKWHCNFFVTFYFGVALALGVLAAPALAEPVRGAGSTFAAPVIGKWAEHYRNWRAHGGALGATRWFAARNAEDYVSPDWNVDYEPVGSLAGMFRLAQPEMDFAATDAPLPSVELRKRGLIQFPIVMGGVVPVINLAGVGQGQLRLNGAILADIYLGKIVKWNDAAIVALNPSLALPDAAIVPVFRSDGSGTTQNFTEFLSINSAEWKTRIGADIIVKWPAGSGVEGSSRVVRKVQETSGAIGYVEYGQVVRAAMKFALVANRVGEFVPPGIESFQAAASDALWISSEDFALSMITATGKRSWPIVAVTYAWMRKVPGSAARQRNTLAFFELVLEQGAADAIALNYAPMPERLTPQIKAYWAEHLTR